MKSIAAIATLLLATFAAAQSPVFTNCATGPTEFAVSSVAVNPFPLCIGQTATYTIAGTLAAPIEAGSKLSIVGRYLGRIVYTDSQDLCTLLNAQGTPCPVAASQTSLTVGVPVKPNFWANINTSWAISATNGNGNLLFCQEAVITAQNCPV